jgi:RNA polymerase sigma-70 factor (ECF subfamily)
MTVYRGDDSPPAATGAADPARQLPTLAQIYRDNHAFVWRSLLRMGVPAGALEDAVHDTFLVVARRMREFRGEASLRTWLFAIVMRVAQSRRRDVSRERRHAETLETLSAASPDAVDPHARAESARILHRLLGLLPDDQRAIFVMAELEQMSAPEMAAVLGVKLPTVYSRLRLAREKLAEAVAAGNGGVA